MIQHLIYKCPKCHNTLLVSNRMLHDLRCTEENPATYENVLRKSQLMEESSPACYIQNNSSSQFSSSLRKSNRDGTSSDIRKSIKYNGEEEYIETKYDAEGNIISRKKADKIGYYSPQNNDYQDVSEFYDYEEEDNDNNYINDDYGKNIYVDPSVGINNNQQIIYHTAEAQEVVYEAPAKYDPNITINQPIQQTIINSDVKLSDNVMNDIIRSSIKQAGNSNINIQINNGNIGNSLSNLNDFSNLNDISTYNFNQTNIINNINNISNDPFNPNFNSDSNNYYNQDFLFGGLNYNDNNNNNNNAIDIDMNPDDVLRRTAGIGSHNYKNMNNQYQDY